MSQNNQNNQNNQNSNDDKNKGHPNHGGNHPHDNQGNDDKKTDVHVVDEEKGAIKEDTVEETPKDNPHQ